MSEMVKAPIIIITKSKSYIDTTSSDYSQCTAKSDTTMYGTCYSSSQCTSKSGTVDGNCAAGFGVCCTFT